MACRTTFLTGDVLGRICISVSIGNYLSYCHGVRPSLTQVDTTQKQTKKVTANLFRKQNVDVDVLVVSKTFMLLVGHWWIGLTIFDSY